MMTLRVLLVLLAASLVGCDESPTTAVVDNAFSAQNATSVYEVWWSTTLFADAVAPGTSSESERTVPGTDTAYALLAPGWSPGDGVTPPRLIAVKSAASLSASAHDTLRIVVSDDTFTGDCASGAPLDAATAALIVERIFPGAFAGLVYDPATCASVDVSADGGADGPTHE